MGREHKMCGPGMAWHGIKQCGACGPGMAWHGMAWHTGFHMGRTTHPRGRRRTVTYNTCTHTRTLNTHPRG